MDFMNLEEAAKKTFYRSMRDGSFEIVDGTKLPNGFFATKVDNNFIKWNISDEASGLALVNKLETLKACKEYIDNLTPEKLAQIEEIRKAPDYLNQVEKVNAFKNKDLNLKETLSILSKIGSDDIREQLTFNLK